MLMMLASGACPSSGGAEQPRLMLMMLASRAGLPQPKPSKTAVPDAMMLVSGARPKTTFFDARAGPGQKTTAAGAHEAHCPPKQSRTAAADAHDARFGCLPKANTIALMLMMLASGAQAGQHNSG